MAEQLVLAELVIDSSGIVRGVRDSTAAIAGFDRRLSDSGKQAAQASGLVDVLSSRFLNLRSVAMATLGGFTVAGAILKISAVTSEVVTSTAAWKAWAGQIEDTFNRLVKGESVLDRTARHLKDAASGTGITPGLVTVENITNLANLAGALASRRNEILGTLTAPFRPDARQAIELSVIEKDLNSVFDALYKIQQQSGLTDKEFDLLFNTHLSTYVKKATRILEEFNDVLKVPVAVIQKAIRLSQESQFDSGPPLREALGLPVDYGIDRGATERGEAFGFSPPGDMTGVRETDIGAANDALTEHEQKILDVTEAYERMGVVADAAYAAVAGAEAAGIISQRDATRIRLALMAAEAFMQGKIEVAKAAAAAASQNYGEAALHGIAAGLFFAAAAFNASAAIRGYGGGESSNQAAASGSASGGGGQRELVFVNNGFAFVNKDDFIRWVSEQQRRSGDR